MKEPNTLHNPRSASNFVLKGIGPLLIKTARTWYISCFVLPKTNLSELRTDSFTVLSAFVDVITQEEGPHGSSINNGNNGNNNNNVESSISIALKRAIDKWKLKSCFVFMINGFDLTFFITKKQDDNCNTMP